jgi:transposase-like protein
VRDRGAGAPGGKIRFSSAILPPYLCRTRSIEELLPWLYLKGISTGDFGEALAAVLGPEAPGLSAATIARLTEVWQGELDHWQRRGLSTRRYVYFWADGVYFSPRLDQDRQCMCVIIGADEYGRIERARCRGS